MNSVRHVFDPERSWVWVILAAPWLWFPNSVPFWAIVVSALTVLPALVTVARGGSVWPHTPFSIPLAVLGVTTAMGFAVSTFPEVSRPKFAGVLLGLLTLRAVLLGARDISWTRLAVTLYVVAGIGIPAVGVFLTGWPYYNKYLPRELIVQIPYIALYLPGTAGWVNPNALGGTTLYSLPLVLSMLAYGPYRPRWVIGLLLGAVLLVGVLVLSQSKTALASISVAIAILALVRSRRFRWSAAIMAGVLVFYQAPVTWLFDRVVMGLTATDRLYIWSQAIGSIRDAPLTGVGLNAFRRMAHTRLTGDDLAPLEVVHAHNVFLQTALDVGLFGLTAYIAILVLATFMSYRVFSIGDPSTKGIALGLWASLVAIHVFGLSDAIVLGAKVGVFFWWNLGLIGALYALSIDERWTSHRIPLLEASSTC